MTEKYVFTIQIPDAELSALEKMGDETRRRLGSEFSAFICKRIRGHLKQVEADIEFERRQVAAAERGRISLEMSDFGNVLQKVSHELYRRTYARELWKRRRKTKLSDRTFAVFQEPRHSGPRLLRLQARALHLASWVVAERNGWTPEVERQFARNNGWFRPRTSFNPRQILTDKELRSLNEIL